MTEAFRAPFTYFIQSEGPLCPIRIGTAMRPVIRLRSLQVGSDCRLKIVGLVRAYAVLEPILHERFASCALRGEWFRPHPRLLELIRLLRQRDPAELLMVEELRELFAKVFPDDPLQGVKRYQIAEGTIRNSRRNPKALARRRRARI